MTAPTTASAATRRVSAALSVSDANDALIHTEKGGYGFVTTLRLGPAQNSTVIAEYLSRKLGFWVEPARGQAFVYWHRPA